MERFGCMPIPAVYKSLDQQLSTPISFSLPSEKDEGICPLVRCLTVCAVICCACFLVVLGVVVLSCCLGLIGQCWQVLARFLGEKHNRFMERVDEVLLMRGYAAFVCAAFLMFDCVCVVCSREAQRSTTKQTVVSSKFFSTAHTLTYDLNGPLSVFDCCSVVHNVLILAILWLFHAFV